MPRSLPPWRGSFEPRPKLEDFKPYEELKPGECAPSHSTELSVGTNALGWQEAQDAMDLRFRNVDMNGRLIHAAIPSASRTPGTAS